MRTGAIFYDNTQKRYDIRFNESDFYGGLHCGETMEVFIRGRWKPTRIEYSHECEKWYFVGFHDIRLDGLRVRV